MHAYFNKRHLIILSFFSLFFLVSIFSPQFAEAAARTASVSGNWSSTTTWGGSSVPVAGDTVTINNGITVTVDTTAACTSITWAGTVNSPSAINISGTNSLTVSGSTTMSRPANGGTKTIAVGAGTFTTGTISLGGTTGGSRLTTLSVSTGTINITGATFTTAGVDSRLTFTGSGTLNTAGTFMSGTKGTFTPSTGTINFNRSGTQTISPFTYTFNNVTLSGSNAKTTTRATINGILSMEGTATTTGTIATYGPAATLQYKGSGAQTTGTEFPATWSGTGGIKIENANGVTLNAVKNIGAQSLTIGNIIPNSVFNDGGFQLTSTGTLNLTSGTLKLGSVSTATTFPGFTTRNISAGTIVEYAAGVTQTVSATPTYSNLVLSGVGLKNAGGAISVGSNLTNSTTFNVAANTLSVTGSIVNTGGTIRFSGATNGLAVSSGTIEYYGASQTIASGTYSSLKINQSSGFATLSGNIIVGGVLTLITGNIDTGVNDLYINSTGSVSRTSGHIIGNLRKYITTGATSKTFEIGDSSNYVPVNVVFDSVTIAGDLTAKTTTGDHPNINSSDIAATYSVNRYWTLTNSLTLPISFTNYDATFNFINPGDIDIGANTSNFSIGQYTVSWSYPTIGTKLSTSTQATGITSFGDFQIGERNNPVPTTTSIDPTSKTIGDAQFSLTVNGTNFVATSVVNFNGSARATTYVSPTQLTATILVTDLTVVGTFPVTVTNPVPGGGTSNAQAFTVNNPVPTTTSINPTSKTIGDAQFSLTVNGTNFVAASVVNFDGSARATTYVSPTQLTATILVTDLTAVGTFPITVTNPVPGGGTSNAQTFEVTEVIPTKFVITSATNGTIDTPSIVTIQAQNNAGQLATTYQLDVTLVTSGSATGGGLVDIINGVGVANISDTVVESVHLSLQDSELTTLDVSSTADISFTPGVTDKLSISAGVTEMVAGNLLPLTVSRRDSSNNLVTVGSETFYLYSNSLSLADKFYDAAIGGNIITEVLISDGTSSTNIWYYDEKVGAPDVTVSDNDFAPDEATGIDDGSLALTVISAPAAVLLLNNPGDLVAGNRLQYDVSREDQFGNPSTNGSLTVYLYRSPLVLSTVFYDAAIDGNQITSLNISSGVTTSSFWLYTETANSYDITISDNSSAPDGAAGIVDATDSLSVGPNSVAVLTLNNPGDMTIGTRLGYIASRFDVYNNIVNTGDLTVYLYSSPLVPSIVFYNAADGGSTITSLVIAGGSNTNNFWLYSDDTGSYNVTASDNSSAPDGAAGIADAVDAVVISPTPVAATKIIITNTPSTIVGDAAAVSIRAEDDLGNLATGFSGSVTLHTSGDATPGGIVTITNGLGSINVIDLKAETVNLSLEDTGSTGLNVSSTNTINFLPGPTANFTIVGADNAVAGQRVMYTISRKDQYNNLVTSGNDTVYLYSNATAGTAAFYNASSGGIQILSTSILNNTSTTDVWFAGTKVGSWTIDASDNGDAPDGATGIVDGIHAISISSDIIARLVLNDPGDMSAGTRLGYIATRYDAYNNLVTSGAANYYLYSNANGPLTTFYNVSSGGSPITNLSFSDGNSTASFWYYEDKVGTWTVYVSDNSGAPDGATGIVDGEDSVIVSAIPIVATKFIIIVSSNSVLIGTPTTVTVRAVDNDDNIDTTYQDDVTLNLSGSAVGGGLIDIINGVGQVLISDLTEENVNLTLEDTESTGLNISSTQNINFTATVVITSGGGGTPTIINPTVSFSGQAFPQANVEIVAIQTGQVPVSNPSKGSNTGNFSVNYSGTLPANVKSFALVVYDKDQNIVQAKIFSLGTSNEIIKTILMAPTLSLKQSTVTRGNFMGVTGSAMPNYKIELMIDSVKVAETAIADANGNYDINFNTYYLDLGEHVLRVRQVDSQGKTSDYSIEKSFTVSKLFIPKADFNNDGKIDVQDLSIFISRFRLVDAVNRQELDLNNDGNIDVQDLSLFIGALSR